MSGFIYYFQIIIAALLVYALTFAILKKIQLFGDKTQVDALIALLTAIIVSFSGVLTYFVKYAVNWFVIILFMVFLLFIILRFVGVESKDITKGAAGNKKVIIGVFVVIFIIIIIKAFFALNNQFDDGSIKDNLSENYVIDTDPNVGFGEFQTKGFFSSLTDAVDSDVLAVAGFLILIGIFMVIIGNGSSKSSAPKK